MSEVTAGIRWLVEERDRLLARVAVLEDELVRRDAVEAKGGHAHGEFSIKVDATALRYLMPRDSTAAIADQLAIELAREVVNRSLHHIRKAPASDELAIWFSCRPIPL